MTHCPASPAFGRLRRGATLHRLRLALVVWAVQAAGPLAQAQVKPATPASAPSDLVALAPATVNNSGLDAPMFYQLLVGEMEAQAGQSTVAFEVMLDAARRSKDDALFQRAIELAVQSRSGDKALVAVQAWRLARPDAMEPVRTQVQLLVAMQRVDDLAEPLGTLLQRVPAGERNATLAGLPRFVDGMTDKAGAVKAAETALAPALAAPDTRTTARVTLGRLALAAEQSGKAMVWLRRAHADDPQSTGPVLLALDLMPSEPGAEAIVQAYLNRPEAAPALRLAYARALERQQRLGDGAAQLRLALAQQPELLQGWLTLGAYLVDLHEPAQAIQALERFLALQAGAATPEAAATDDDDSGVRNQRATDFAWQLLAQAEEQQGRLPAAAAWLAKIDTDRMDLSVLSRRASLMARQGQLDAARKLLREAPAHDQPDARARIMAEAQLLRDQRQWQPAYDVLLKGMQANPDDSVLTYELAMLAERLARYDDMETLLRRVMSLKPDDAHAYNALGYSLTERNIRLDEARQLLLRASQLAPSDPFIVDSLGWVEFRLGRLDEAQRLLRQSWQSRPHPEVAAHLGEVLWALGRQDEARQIFKDGARHDANNEVLLETVRRLKAAP
jgi:tetratricopeptide (TPR) repeat protein